MPQIDQISDFWSSRVFWLLVFFGVTFVVVGLGMVPRSSARSRCVTTRSPVISLRPRRRAMPRMAMKRRGASARMPTAQRLDSDRRSQGQGGCGHCAAKLAEAQGRLDTRLAEAEAAINAARSSAMAEIEGVAADVARDIVARVAGAEVEPAAAEAAVKEVMAHG